MPSGDSQSAGPMPDRCSTCVDPIDPAHRIDFALGAGLDHLVALDEAHADGAAVLDDQPVDQHVLFQPQIARGSAPA